VGKLSKREDERQRRATAAAIAAVRKLTRSSDAVINENMPIGRLTDAQLGWIVAAVIFAWIATRAEQAATEGLDTEMTIRATGLDPNPWDAGAVAATLPQLADVPDVDWSKPFFDWPRESMIAFLTAALGLARTGIIARDLGGGLITRKSGGDKLDDPVPF
jgi:hypothetical protein